MRRAAICAFVLMFRRMGGCMVVSMSEIDRRVGEPLVDWSDLGVSGLLPTGTVTLLLADVEGSTRLWETQAEVMTAAIARLNQVVGDVIAAHDGVHPVEQGEGDSFVAAFARASDAVAAAVELQRAPLAPIRLRIGVHTGEVQLRDEGNYAGPTINRTARLRDLGHGGQTVLSGATEQLVVDRLPEGAWLTDLGSHPLRDLPRPERVVQLCHPDLVNEFPPLRVLGTVVSQRLPAQLTSFVGRGTELTQLRELLAQNRVVTLTGAGGVGKTRLAIQVAAAMAPEFVDGVWCVDLAPLTDPELVAVTVARALGLPDQPGRSIMDSVLRFVRDRQLLVVLDNCEHLLDACAELVVAVLSEAARLTVLATSREAIGVAGEVSWRVPSLSRADEAIALFSDRARNVRPDFALTDDNAATVGEICARLDGVPLAIELAAARVRALSLAEILDSLHDRFRLLTGGARTAVRRQQTLRASVDWSHALLTEPERILFRRLAVFLGGFEFDAARAVAGSSEVERYQVLDQLTLLVDKSLVVASKKPAKTGPGIGCWRRCANTPWKSWAIPARPTRCGRATATTTRRWPPCLTRRPAPIMNSTSSRPTSRSTTCAPRSDGAGKTPTASWRWRWRRRCSRYGWRGAASGKGWPGSTPPSPISTRTTPRVTAAVRARALADKAVLDNYLGATNSLDQAEQAVAIARDVDDPALLARTLTAYGFIASLGYQTEVARECFAEAIGLARTVDDRWRLSQILAEQAQGAHIAGDPLGICAVAEEGRDLADAIGDRFNSRACRFYLAIVQQFGGDLAGSAAQFGEVAAEAEAAHDEIWRVTSLGGHSIALGRQGEAAAARAAAEAILEGGAGLGGRWASFGHVVLWIRGLGRRGFRGRARGARGRSAVPGFRERRRGGIAAHLECRGRAGRPRSRCCAPLGRRGRVDNERLVADVGAHRARSGGDRAG